MGNTFWRLLSQLRNKRNGSKAAVARAREGVLPCGWPSIRQGYQAGKSLEALENRVLLSAAPLANAKAQLTAASATTAGAVFVIAMENHNFTQPSPTSSPQQILGNVAAPYINSLITPGNSNAVQTSYATAYYSTGVHPSEPNYIWAEAGSNLGVTSDNDPSTANNNLFTGVTTLTDQMDAAGITWKNYQEDLQDTSSPAISASGTGSVVNAYNGSTQYGYAAKHNPTAFFTDSQNKNVYQLGQLQTDLTNNTVGQFNWITPDLYNDMHTALSGGFTYNGPHYTGDQAAVAQGDNFLSILVPEIEASQAYKNNGTIVIWGDETEGGDTTSYTIPEIVISPLARGNAHASSVSMSHSSDIKMWEEDFGLGAALNSSVAAANDLTSLFQSTTITTQPLNRSVSAGNTATFTAAATGFPTPTIQWQLSTDGGGTFNYISGATSSPLKITGATAAQNNDRYRAVFTNTQGATTSNAATLTVVSVPTLVGNPVINGDNPNGLYTAAGQPANGVQRSMVEDVVYTFNEAVTIPNANQAFTVVVANSSGSIGAVAPTNLIATAVAGSNGTQWAVSLTGQAIGVLASIANGEYTITINPSFVFAAADGTTAMAAGTGRSDNFYRLFGDMSGSEVLTALDNARLKTALSVYNAAFDYTGNGVAIVAIDNAHFKQAMSINFLGDGFMLTI